MGGLCPRHAEKHEMTIFLSLQHPGDACHPPASTPRRYNASGLKLAVKLAQLSPLLIGSLV